MEYPSLQTKEGYFGTERILTNIILTNVHAFNAGSQSNINTIVDEQWYAFWLGHGMKLLSYADQIFRFTCLVSKLDDRGAYVTVNQIVLNMYGLSERCGSNLLLQQHGRPLQCPCDLIWRACYPSQGILNNLRAFCLPKFCHDEGGEMRDFMSMMV